MPNEKKYTLDDILAEYDDNTDSDTVSVGALRPKKPK